MKKKKEQQHLHHSLGDVRIACAWLWIITDLIPDITPHENE